ncbi:MAG TPA: (2Fe-2S)-binding protein [Desulfarculaceae bacterium]|nr:(2Fe-2S)-binding protein [Desulfarculaceae bacterium]
MEKLEITLNINDEPCRLTVSANETLRDVLRERLELTGTKAACDDGSCGACTVLLNGKPVRSCLTLAVEAETEEITTIEGLADDNKLHPLQQIFVDHHAIQCGFCSPGMILTGLAAIKEQQAELSRAEIREAISGNQCRCTGYAKIVDAIQAASQEKV